MPRAFSEREKEIIRSRLLQEGLKIFALYGLKKTNIEDLTRSIGISKGAFYLFYDSKEALYMDVLEVAEEEFRRNVLAGFEEEAASPRSLFSQVLLKAFTSWKSSPILQMVSRGEYDQLLLKLPPETIREHLKSDQGFVKTIVETARYKGVNVTADVEKISGLMNALFFVSLHENDFGAETYQGTIELLIELITAYCLGEVPAEAVPLQQR
ncbi:MAG: TetR/AcrR family transcriptional regulator [Anaerolineae bacterium]|nr:TetR/AcrR family transcriptional regulator [Anaerolineae bacterium]